MKDHPMLFSAPMILALLAGNKTQTRRIVKPQPTTKPFWGCVGGKGFGFFDDLTPIRCQYGQPGDRLWVRETWQYADWTEDGYPFIGYHADGERLLVETNIPEEWSERLTGIWADLSAEENYRIENRAADRRWRPSIHMPRWASRINLEIVSVRVERLQDISEAAAIAEGLKGITKDGKLIKYGIPDADGYPGTDDIGWPWENWCASPIDAYCSLWESINGAGSWDANPWVWVIEFKVVKP